MALNLGLGLALTRNKGGFPGAFNVTPAWKAAVKSNWSSKDVIFMGDSTTRGQGAGEGGDVVLNRAAHNITAAFQSLLQARGYSASRDSIFGGGGTSDVAALLLTEDSRFVWSGAWTLNASPAEMAGGPWFYNNTDTAPWILAPTDAWDQAHIYRRRATGFYSWAVDGGGATNIDGSPGVDTRVQIDVVSQSLGVHTLTLRRVSGIAQIGAVEFRNTTNARKQIINLGRNGALSSLAAGTSLNSAPLPNLGKILEQRTAPLVLINFGINDENQSVTTTDFKTSVQAIIDMVVSKGGIPMLLGHNATATTPGDAYVQAHRELSMTNGIPYFNLAAIYSWAQIKALGWNYDTSSHLKAEGYAGMAARLDAFLAWAVR